MPLSYTPVSRSTLPPLPSDLQQQSNQKMRINMLQKQSYSDLVRQMYRPRASPKLQLQSYMQKQLTSPLVRE